MKFLFIILVIPVITLAKVPVINDEALKVERVYTWETLYTEDDGLDSDFTTKFSITDFDERSKTVRMSWMHKYHHQNDWIQIADFKFIREECVNGESGGKKPWLSLRVLWTEDQWVNVESPQGSLFPYFLNCDSRETNVPERKLPEYAGIERAIISTKYFGNVSVFRRIYLERRTKFPYPGPWIADKSNLLIPPGVTVQYEVNKDGQKIFRELVGIDDL